MNQIKLKAKVTLSVEIDTEIAPDTASDKILVQRFILSEAFKKIKSGNVSGLRIEKKKFV